MLTISALVALASFTPDIGITVKDQMFKTALSVVIKRYWMLALSIVIASNVFQYWRDHQISFPMMAITFRVVVLALLTVALPVELHKTRSMNQ